MTPVNSWVRRGVGRASSYMIAMAIQSPDGHLPCSPFLDWAWSVPLDSWLDRWIIVALAQFSNGSGTCDPGAAEIERATGLGDRSIRKSLARLDAAGLIRRENISGRAARIRLCEAALSAVKNVSAETTDPGASCTVASPTPVSGAQNPGTCCTLTTLNNPDTDTCARGRTHTCDPITIDALAACGVPAHEAHRLHGLSEPIRWRDELCLDHRAVLEVLHRVASTTRWYIASAPGRPASLVAAYLEGNRAPVLDSRQGFEVDGMEFRCRLDFGAAFLDWRGWITNPGA